MKGFNYQTAQEFDLPIAKLREDLKSICDAGGRRRVEADSLGPVTYAHGKDGLMIWEAWGNVQLKKSGDQGSLIDQEEDE